VLDSHCHLDFPEFDADRTEVILAARAVGVEGFLVPGVHPGLWAAQEALRSEPGVSLAVGLHPWWLAFDEPLEERMVQLASRVERLGAVAIGECGLDGKRAGVVPLDVQLLWFEAQLELGRQRDLPVVLHQVGAREEFLAALGRGGPLRRGGIVHGFGGDASWARALVARGFSLGFGARTLAPKAERTREAFLAVPLDRLLLETDAPAGGSGGIRGLPADLAPICHGLAGLRGLSAAELAAASDANLARLLGSS